MLKTTHRMFLNVHRSHIEKVNLHLHINGKSNALTWILAMKAIYPRPSHPWRDRRRFVAVSSSASPSTLRPHTEWKHNRKRQPGPKQATVATQSEFADAIESCSVVTASQLSVSPSDERTDCLTPSAHGTLRLWCSRIQNNCDSPQGGRGSQRTLIALAYSPQPKSATALGVSNRHAVSSGHAHDVAQTGVA